MPRNPCRTPSYFPSAPASVFDDPSVFEKFNLDVLFFIFYYQQGSPQQYLAALELKKQSWRYHKQFLSWFQRHDDPKVCLLPFACLSSPFDLSFFSTHTHREQPMSTSKVIISSSTLTQIGANASNPISPLNIATLKTNSLCRSRHPSDIDE
jgi:hypothetical protein